MVSVMSVAATVRMDVTMIDDHDVTGGDAGSSRDRPHTAAGI
jgi:hypothetical protein